MTNEEYIQTQWTIMAADAALRLGGGPETVCEMVKDVDFTAFLDRIDRAETIGPLLDPTLWIKAHSAMDMVKEAATRLRDMCRPTRG